MPAASERQPEVDAENNKTKTKFFLSVGPVFFRYGVSQEEAGVEIRGGGQPAQAEVVPAEEQGPGRELRPGQEGEEPAAPGLPAGGRRRPAAAAQTWSRRAPEGP